MRCAETRPAHLLPVFRSHVVAERGHRPTSLPGDVVHGNIREGEGGRPAAREREIDVFENLCLAGTMHEGLVDSDWHRLWP